MNKREKEQLRASIAKDFVQGQVDSSPTRELLRQYAPLEGIITTPSPNVSPLTTTTRSWPVENSLVPHATVAQSAHSPWHGATVAPAATVASGATVARLATVKGELRVPNTINFRIFPTLNPFAKAVYYQLFLLSHGFQRDRCVVGLVKLARSVLMSLRKVQDTIVYLEKRGLIKRLGSNLGGPAKGSIYHVPLPAALPVYDAAEAETSTLADNATVAQCATVAPAATVARHATNKDDDDDIKENHHQRAGRSQIAAPPVENHSSAAAPRERQGSTDRHFALVRDAYEKATGNTWNVSDFNAYEEHDLEKLPAEKIVSAIHSVARRTPAKINSFRYFVKEIVAVPDPRNRAWQKKQLEKIVRRIRDSSVGRAGHSETNFIEDVKCACAREGLPFDNDIFNELVT